MKYTKNYLKQDCKTDVTSIPLYPYLSEYPQSINPYLNCFFTLKRLQGHK